MVAFRFLSWSFSTAALLIGLLGCAAYPLPSSPSGKSYSRSDSAFLESESILHPGPQPDARPGLATSFGEALNSRMDYTDFERGRLAKPFAVGVLYYNDAEGAEAMAHHFGTPVRLHRGLVSTAEGVADWGLKSPGSGVLGGYIAEDTVILKGKAGDRYGIFLRNNTRQPLEFVVSVDGLDVIDGEPASYSKRGYIVGPKRSIEIQGFRTSTSKVAAFRFGRVGDSYAVLRHDDARNVGVVGLAVFSRGGTNPWLRPKTSSGREGANPFPGQRFAIPPS